MSPRSQIVKTKREANTIHAIAKFKCVGRLPAKKITIVSEELVEYVNLNIG